MTTYLKRAALVVAMLLCASPAFAAFNYRTPRVVQSGKITGTLTNWVAPVILNDARYKTVANSGHVNNGNDIRFASDTACTSMLTYQKITYSATAGTGYFRVLIASAAVSTTIQICYGDASLSSDGSSTSTWPSTYKLVALLPDGTTLSGSDSTSNANNLTNTSGTANAGKLGGGVSLNGSTAFLSKTTTSSLNITGTAMSGEAWINPASFGGGSKGRIIDHGNYIWYVDNSNITAGLSFTPDVGMVAFEGSNNSVISTGSLQFVAFTYDGANVRHYVAGAAAGAPGEATTIPSATNTLYVGDNGSLTRQFDGVIDELRLYAGTLTAAWIGADYNAENDNVAFWPDGTEVQLIHIVQRRTPACPRTGSRCVQ